MAKENEQQEDERHPYEAISEKAEGINFEDDQDRADWIEAKMKRAGFKKGPGEWIAISDDDDDDDGDHEDDDKPVTRGEIRRMNKERQKKANANYSPPRKTREKKEDEGKKDSQKDTWW